MRGIVNLNHFVFVHVHFRTVSEVIEKSFEVCFSGVKREIAVAIASVVAPPKVEEAGVELHSGHISGRASCVKLGNGVDPSEVLRVRSGVGKVEEGDPFDLAAARVVKKSMDFFIPCMRWDREKVLCINEEAEILLTQVPHDVVITFVIRGEPLNKGVAAVCCLKRFPVCLKNASKEGGFPFWNACLYLRGDHADWALVVRGSGTNDDVDFHLIVETVYSLSGKMEVRVPVVPVNNRVDPINNRVV